MSSELIIKCKWSNELDNTIVDDFIKVQNEVFNNGYTRKYFSRKYENNIYGNSVICVAYIHGMPIAARGLWRNDLVESEGYQPVDTCVLTEYRGKGIFSKMTTQAISMIPSSAIIYNFPNQNSYPGYIKLGWHEKGQYHLVLLNNKKYRQEHFGDIDTTYFEWWIKPTNNLFYIKRGDVYYIVAPTFRRFCFIVIGTINKTLATQLPKLKGLSIIFFKSKKVTFYNKRFASSHVVSTNSGIAYIPSWKIDALV